MNAKLDTTAELTPRPGMAAPEVEVGAAVDELVPVFVSLMVADAVGVADVGYALPKASMVKGAEIARMSVRFCGLVRLDEEERRFVRE